MCSWARGSRQVELYEHQRHIAATLQASLLPASLPEIAGLDVAVGYWASGPGTEVGVATCL